MPFKDITGQQFSDLIAIKHSHKKGNKHYWLFRCKCGKEAIKRKDQVLNGKFKHCGNHTGNKNHRRKENGEAAFNTLYRTYKYHAKLRKLSFDLTREKFKELTSSNCYYCNIKPSREQKSRTTVYICNGIDRVDNHKGYEVNNCVPCCRRCNSIKMGISKDMIEKIYKFIFKE